MPATVFSSSALNNSTARIHVTGPIYNYAEFKGPGDIARSIFFLGTCETKPQARVTHFKSDIFNDLGGRKVPIQQLAQGSVATIGMLLNLFDYNAISALEGLNSGTPATGEAGIAGPLSRGQFIHGSTRTCTLYQGYTYADTTNSSAGMPRGRIWHSCFLESHEIVDSGTTDEKLMLVFSALPLYNSTTGAFGLYSDVGHSETWKFPAAIYNDSTFTWYTGHV